MAGVWTFLAVSTLVVLGGANGALLSCNSPLANCGGTNGHCNDIQLGGYYCTCDGYAGLDCSHIVQQCTAADSLPADVVNCPITGPMRLQGIQVDSMLHSSLLSGERGWTIDFQIVDQNKLGGTMRLPPFVDAAPVEFFAYCSGTASQLQASIDFYFPTLANPTEPLRATVARVAGDTDYTFVFAPDQQTCNRPSVATPSAQSRAFILSDCNVGPLHACPISTLYQADHFTGVASNVAAEVVVRFPDDEHIIADVTPLAVGLSALHLAGSVACVPSLAPFDPITMITSIPAPSALSVYETVHSRLLLKRSAAEPKSMILEFDDTLTCSAFPEATAIQWNLVADPGVCHTPTCNPIALGDAYPDALLITNTTDLINALNPPCSGGATPCPSASPLFSSSSCESVFNIISAMAYWSTSPPVAPAGQPDAPGFVYPCPAAVTEIDFVYSGVDGKEHTASFGLRTVSDYTPPVGGSGAAGGQPAAPYFFGDLPGHKVQIGLYTPTSLKAPQHPFVAPFSSVGVRSFVMEGVTYDVNQQTQLLPLTTHDGVDCFGVRQHAFGVKALAGDDSQVFVAVVVQENSYYV